MGKGNEDNLEKGRQTMKDRKAENIKEQLNRSKGGDPEHPVAGSAAWAEKNNLPADTKDIPR